ncbi:hypothetical protein FACS1894219_08760 [Clostridia bacterium]|nr:hypothetical protein FACS1894219_08760 [Clostridia bacterium]
MIEFGSVSGFDAESLDTIVSTLMSLLPILIPFAILQMGLMIAALVHILRHKTYKNGSRVMWVLIVLLVSTIGPILYFIIGRSDDNNS